MEDEEIDTPEQQVKRQLELILAMDNKLNRCGAYLRKLYLFPMRAAAITCEPQFKQLLSELEDPDCRKEEDQDREGRAK